MSTPATRSRAGISDGTAPLGNRTIEGAFSIETQARKEGMLTMLEDGIYKAAKGLTSVEEVLRVINE